MTANGPFRTPEHLFTNGSFRFDGNTEAMTLRRYLRQRGVENPILGYFCGGVRKGSRAIVCPAPSPATSIRTVRLRGDYQSSRMCHVVLDDGGCHPLRMRHCQPEVHRAAKTLEIKGVARNVRLTQEFRGLVREGVECVTEVAWRGRVTSIEARKVRRN